MSQSAQPKQSRRPDSTDAFAIGSVLADKYFVHRTIGEGGLGVVVAATHLHLEQQVAIKFLNARARENPALLERFMHEARLSAMVRSNHSVRVYDVARTPDGVPYMVMELLEGEDLGTALRRGPLPIAQAVDYVLQGCEALAEAHSIGIVHRDLKPENMFLARSAGGTPVLKILDFGISKLVEKVPGEARARVHTEVAECFGTPIYMSPEQLRSSTHVDSRTDIWAIGVVLHELITGQRPFDQPSLAQLGVAIAGEPHVKLSAALPGVPSGLEAIVDRCLEKDPARRYRNVAELAQELAPFGPPTATPTATKIACIVTGGGQSIRPPIAMSEPIDDEPDLAQPLLLVQPLPSLPIPLRASSRSARRRGRWLAAGAAVALAGIAALGVVRSRARAEAPVGFALVAAAPPPSGPSIAVAPPPVVPVVSASPARATPAAAPAGTWTDARAASRIKPRPSPPPPPASAPVVMPPRPAPAAVTPAIDAASKRAIFGDRQ